MCGPRVTNAIEQRFFVDRTTVGADVRRIDTHELDVELLLQLVGRENADSGGSADQVDTPLPSLRAMHEGQDEIRARNLLGQGRSQEVRRPDERLAIDEAQTRLVVGGAK